MTAVSVRPLSRTVGVRGLTLRHSARLEDPRKAAALAELRKAQLDRPGAPLPIPVAIPIALHQVRRLLPATGRARHSGNLRFHQPPGGKANHPAQKSGARGLPDEVAQVHHVGGPLGLGLGSKDRP